MPSTSRQVGYVITIVVAGMLIAFGALHISGFAPVYLVEALSRAAILQHRVQIGMIAISAGMFLLAPGLLPFGNAFASSVLGGIIAIDLVAEHSLWPPIAVLLLLWLGAGLRSGWLQRTNPTEPGSPSPPLN